MTQMKKGFQRLLALTLWVLIAALAGTGLLTAVYTLPTSSMAAHMDDSAQVLIREGEYPQLYPWCTSQLDNYTDAIILMNAAYDSQEPPMVRAMTAARPGIQGLDSPGKVLKAHYQDGVPYDEAEPYYQYWHGYLVLMKPLLLMMDYSGIRVLNAVCQILLTVFLLWLMARGGRKRYIIPYLLALAFLMPVTLAKSLQFSSCYYIMTLGAIAVLLLEKRLEKADVFLFLFLGIGTAYIDFLTYPIATLGIPAVFYFLVRDTMPAKQTLCKGCALCFSWGFGYAAMWASKWLIGSIVTGSNVLSVASGKLAERSSLNVLEDESLLLNMRSAIGENLRAFLRTPATPVLLLAGAAAVVLLIVGYKRHSFRMGDLAVSFFPFLVLAAAPLVWYAATANHSTIHSFFTNKALVVSVFAAMCAPLKLLEHHREA